jgi:hypothetical protein
VPSVILSSRESYLSFEDNIYVINFIYFRHWLFCIHFIIGMSRNLFPGTHYEHLVCPNDFTQKAVSVLGIEHSLLHIEEVIKSGLGGGTILPVPQEKNRQSFFLLCLLLVITISHSSPR